MSDTSSQNLIIGVPSKGRLQENAAAFFARAGLPLVQGRGVRDYRGVLAGMPGVEIAYLSAADIVAQLGTGAIHLGVTGADLIQETLPQANMDVELLAPLGFGEANVVVAVPQAWIDVRDMADLEDVAATYRAKRGARMRVATKYINLTRRYFSQMGVSDYRIVESLGATEGAPAAGQAELIVDITTSGATLAANALKVLDDGIILRSEAHLVASLKASWSEPTREAARRILSRIAAEEEARTTRDLHAELPGLEVNALADLSHQAETLFAARGQKAMTQNLLLLNAHENKVAALADWLVSKGADYVTVTAPKYIFAAKNVLYERLSARLQSSF